MKIGAQFYTLREFCQTTEGLYESLQRVADMGYRTVQLSGVCQYDPREMKEQLDRLGLSCVLTHIPPDRLLNEPEKVAADHEILGCHHIGLGFYDFKQDEKEHTVANFVAKFKPTAAVLRDAGKYFMYHNHDGEFDKIGGTTILQQLSEGFAPEEMGFVLDTFWIQAGGADPAYWIEKLSGRVPVIHLKDYAYGRNMAVIGEGNINFDRVFEKAESAGTRYMMVEQDNCNGEDPFQCLRRSYAYLKAQGFE